MLETFSDDEEIAAEFNFLSIENLKETILDMEVPQMFRVEAFQKYVQMFPDDKLEITYKLASMYTFSSGLSLLHKYLYTLCTETQIEILLKIILVKSLLEIENKIKKNDGYKVLDTICSQLSINVPTPIRVETVRILMENAEYKSHAIMYFKEIISDMQIECEYRYKCVLDLEKLKTSFKNYYICIACKNFLENFRNMTMYRILSAQYLLQHCSELIERQEIELYLVSFAIDEELDYNLRADAADTLLSLGSEENAQTAREIIIALGQEKGVVRNIYENAQNVHNEEFEKSTMKGFEFISTIPIMKSGETIINFPYVEGKIKDCFNDELRKKDKRYNEQCEMIEVSLNRIEVDRTLFSKYNLTLKNILLKVWTYIQEHEFSEEMEIRLREELIDMSGTCATGFASRLLNVISGFGDFNFCISWEDQITANFTGRLNNKARNILHEWREPEYLQCIIENILKNDQDLKLKLIKNYLARNFNIIIPEDRNDILSLTQKRSKDDTFVDEIIKVRNKGLFLDSEKYMNEFLMSSTNYLDEMDYDPEKVKDYILEDFQGKVLEELPMDSIKHHERSNFLTFFRESVSDIMDEMYEEFKDHISDSDFDLYFRKAIMKYEGL